jgi:hypothetical protein
MVIYLKPTINAMILRLKVLKSKRMKFVRREGTGFLSSKVPRLETTPPTDRVTGVNAYLARLLVTMMSQEACSKWSGLFGNDLNLY